MTKFSATLLYSAAAALLGAGAPAGALPQFSSPFGGSSGGSSPYGGGLGSGSSSGGGLPGLGSGTGSGSGMGGGLPGLGSGTGSGLGGGMPSGLPGLGGGSGSSPFSTGSGGGSSSSSGGSSSGSSDSSDSDSGSSSSSSSSGSGSGSGSGLSSSPFGSGLGGLAGGGSSTRNDFTEGGCKGTVVIFARGTTETGNVGSTAGPAFFDALTALDSDVAVQGVDYAAAWDGAIAGGDKAGSQTMADLITQVTSKCADAKVVISGYSQGAQLVHNAAKSLGSDVTGKVAKAVVFGDPYSGQDVAGVPDVLSFCHSGDTVCAAGGKTYGNGQGHLTYGNDAEEAAKFVVGK